MCTFFKNFDNSQKFGHALAHLNPRSSLTFCFVFFTNSVSVLTSHLLRRSTMVHPKYLSPLVCCLLSLLRLLTLRLPFWHLFSSGAPCSSFQFLVPLVQLSQPLSSSYAKRSFRTKAVRGKKKPGSVLGKRPKQVTGSHLRSSPVSAQLVESPSDDEYDDDYDDGVFATPFRRQVNTNKYASLSASPTNNGTVESSSSTDGSASNDDHSELSHVDVQDDFPSPDTSDESSSSDSSNGSSSAASGDESFSVASSRIPAAGGGGGSDVLSVPSAMDSQQPLVSSSDSSSFIGPRRNPERTARSKVSSYEFGDYTSDRDIDCSSSDESVSSALADDSFSAPPHSVIPSSRSLFKVSNNPLSSGRAFLGAVENLPLGSPETGPVSRRSTTSMRIGTRPSTTAVKALGLLRPSNRSNDGQGKGSGRPAKHNKIHRHGVVTSSVAIPPEMIQCLNKSEKKQIKSLLRNAKPAIYYSWAEDYSDDPRDVGEKDPP